MIIIAYYLKKLKKALTSSASYPAGQFQELIFLYKLHNRHNCQSAEIQDEDDNDNNPQNINRREWPFLFEFCFHDSSK